MRNTSSPAFVSPNNDDAGQPPVGDQCRHRRWCRIRRHRTDEPWVPSPSAVTAQRGPIIANREVAERSTDCRHVGGGHELSQASPSVSPWSDLSWPSDRVRVGGIVGNWCRAREVNRHLGRIAIARDIAGRQTSAVGRLQSCRRSDPPSRTDRPCRPLWSSITLPSAVIVTEMRNTSSPAFVVRQDRGSVASSPPPSVTVRRPSEGE